MQTGHELSCIAGFALDLPNTPKKIESVCAFVCYFTKKHFRPSTFFSSFHITTMYSNSTKINGSYGSNRILVNTRDVCLNHTMIIGMEWN